MNRITNANIEHLLKAINEKTNAPMTPWTRHDDGHLRANPGCYVLDPAYGRVGMNMICNESGGEKDILPSGTKSELYYQMRAFLAGLQALDPPETL